MQWLRDQMWTRQQRKFLSILLLIIALYLVIDLIRDSRTVSSQLPQHGSLASELVSQLDLNNVDADSLSAIPRLGQVKARAIVAYRQQFTAAHPGQRAFNQMDDLVQIKGIGPSTMQLLREYTFISNPKMAAVGEPKNLQRR
jgi:competence protein ComEA